MTNYGPALWVPSSLGTVGSELGTVSVTSQEALASGLSFVCKEQLVRAHASAAVPYKAGWPLTSFCVCPKGSCCSGVDSGLHF